MEMLREIRRVCALLAALSLVIAAVPARQDRDIRLGKAALASMQLARSQSKRHAQWGGVVLTLSDGRVIELQDGERASFNHKRDTYERVVWLQSAQNTNDTLHKNG